jgi:hypothetical protein
LEELIPVPRGLKPEDAEAAFLVQERDQMKCLAAMRHFFAGNEPAFSFGEAQAC